MEFFNPKTAAPDGILHVHEDGIHFRLLRHARFNRIPRKIVLDVKTRWDYFLKEYPMKTDSQGRLRNQNGDIVEFIPMDKTAADTMRPDLDRLYGHRK